MPGSGTPIRAFKQSGEGPPLVLLHATLSAAWWLPVMRLLDGHTVIAPDLPGHGLSGPVDLDQHGLRAVAVDLVAAALSAVGAQRGVPVGSSLGGMIALWTSLDRPDLVSRLVLVGAPGVAFPGARGDVVLGSLAVPRLARLLLAGGTLPGVYGRLLDFRTPRAGPDAELRVVAGGHTPWLADTEALVTPMLVFARSRRPS